MRMEKKQNCKECLAQFVFNNYSRKGKQNGLKRPIKLTSN